MDNLLKNLNTYFFQPFENLGRTFNAEYIFEKRGFCPKIFDFICNKMFICLFI